MINFYIYIYWTAYRSGMLKLRFLFLFLFFDLVTSNANIQKGSDGRGHCLYNNVGNFLVIANCFIHESSSWRERGGSYEEIWRFRIFTCWRSQVLQQTMLAISTVSNGIADEGPSNGELVGENIHRFRFRGCIFRGFRGLRCWGHHEA